MEHIGTIRGKGNGQAIVTRQMVHDRTQELALIDGRNPHQILQVDYERAKREITGESPIISKIKEIFEPWQIAQFLETPRRLGALGHTADEEGHKLFRSQLDESENLRADSRNLIFFEQAREWLLEEET